MPYYLSSYIGTGTSSDPCRPIGSDQAGWSAIDLRADGGATIDGDGFNRCLVYLPIADADPGLTLIATDLTETIPPATLNVFRNRLGLDDQGVTRFDQVIAAALMLPPAGKWKALRACGRGRMPGRFEIWLGGLLWQSPVMAGGSRLIENWNVANSSSPNGNLTWTDFGEGATPWEVSSNRARHAGNVGENIIRAEHDLADDSMVVEVTLVTHTFVDQHAYFAVIGRIDPTSNSTLSTWRWYQQVAFRDLAPTNDHRVFKFVNGSATQLGSTDTTDIAAGERISLTCDGSSITARRNGVVNVGPVTDTALVGYRRSGVSARTTHASNVVELDDFEAKDVASPDVARINRIRPRPFAPGLAR